jgi:itaconate CoA-transferase
LTLHEPGEDRASLDEDSTYPMDCMVEKQLRPLDGITVIALEHAIAAPFCTRQLADLGARVIKVERLGVGDFARGYDERAEGLSSHFVWCNRSKESIAINLKHPDGAKILQRLAGIADVVVQNLAPGASHRLGLSYEALSATNPKVIVCDISGYGSNGPYRDKKAYDLLIQSESGFVSITGTPETPSKAGNSIADIAAGMYAYTNILAALMMREKTGKGYRIDISMLESMVEWMGYPLYYSWNGAEPPARTGGSHATIFPYGPFAASDGKVIMLGLQNEPEWKLFCQDVLQMPELANDPRFSSNSLRVKEREVLGAMIHEVFSLLTGEELIQRLELARIANAQMNNMHEVWAHPQLEARERWQQIDTPAGPLPALFPPGVPGAFVPRMGAVPSLGQQTQVILEELGFDSEAILELHKNMVV